MGGREFFDANKGNPQKCKLLQQESADTLAAWEQEEVSEYSPGIVDDEELLYQQIVDPTHINPTEQALKPTAFQDSANKGMSVNRIAHSSLAQLIERGSARATKFNAENPDRPPKTLWGFAKFKAKRVREILDGSTQQRAFYVYDTANKDDPSHADICQGVKEAKQVRRSVRFSLYDLALEPGTLEKL